MYIRYCSLLILSTYFTTSYSMYPLHDDKLYFDDYDGQLMSDTEPIDSECPSACSCLGETVDCSGLELITPPKLPEWAKVVDLSHNKFMETDGELAIPPSNFSNLKLARNSLTKFPRLINFTTIESLHLGQNRLTDVSLDVLISLPGLKLLDLSRNHFERFNGNGIPATNIIDTINLNGNHISELTAESFLFLSNLTILRLNSNPISRLETGVFSPLVKLTKLDLSNTRITTIPHRTFANLPLRSLYLGNCLINQLPNGAFDGLKRLNELTLQGNRLKSVRKDMFKKLSKLSTLNLANNFIETIELKAWHHLRNLNDLNLSFNRLRIINRQTFDCPAKLLILNLSNNSITDIDDNGFKCQKKLLELNLTGNRLTLSNDTNYMAFRSFGRLKILQLTDNDIQRIKFQLFAAMVRLQTINFNWNPIETIEFDGFATTKLSNLMINSPKLICDCSLGDFVKWVNSTGIIKQLEATCGQPKSLTGRLLRQLKPIDLICSIDKYPTIIDEPKSQIAIFGQRTTLTCSAASDYPAGLKFRWRHDTETFDATMVTINETIAYSTFDILNTTRQDGGRYQCFVSNRFGSQSSQRVKITVASMPVFGKTPTNVTVKAQETARLDCSAVGNPQPQIAWQKDGGDDFPAALERRMKVMTRDHAFYIVNAQLIDSGLYTCTAENSAGIIRANATISVIDAPIVEQMFDKNVEEGQSVVLACSAYGAPKPTLEWFKNDRQIERTDRHFFAADEQLLILVDALPSDAGTYSCELRNQLGSDRKSMHLSVLTRREKEMIRFDEMTAFIVISVVICAVITSAIWVVIIYHMRKFSFTATATETGRESVRFVTASDKPTDQIETDDAYGSGSFDSRSTENYEGQKLSDVIRRHNTEAGLFQTGNNTIWFNMQVKNGDGVRSLRYWAQRAYNRHICVQLKRDPDDPGGENEFPGFEMMP